MKFLRVAILSCAVLFAFSAQAAPFKHRMIAVDDPHAAQAALEIMREGGSAVDAAIAAQMVLTLTEPESTGVGGGAFMLLWDPAQHRVTSFDGRETAPSSATPGMFLDANGQPRPHFDAVPGGLSVGVPGVVAMLELAHKKYGKLPWAKLFEPAIRLSEKGFPVSEKLARTIRAYPQMKKMPDIARYFYKKNGEPLSEGDILKNPELANTLRIIARGGAKAFYTGRIAQAIVAKVRNAPVNRGGMQLSDLANYTAKEREPVCGNYRIYHLCSMGPPSSGGISVLQILGMLERFPSKDLQPDSLSEVHLFSEASRLAFADRAKYMADSDFIPVPIEGLLDHKYLAERSALINPARDMGKAEAGNPPMKHALLLAPQRTPQLHGTSHFSIVDDNGQVVSMTTTVEFAFGSEMMARGFILNNELTDFSFDPEIDGKPVANAPAPGKRPLSAMSPTIMFTGDGEFKIALGSPGGPIIIPYVAETIVGMVDGDLTPEQAAALPHHANPNSATVLEEKTPIVNLAPQLKAMGHDVQIAHMDSGLNIIERVKGGYIGATDPRRDGVAVGE